MRTFVNVGAGVAVALAVQASAGVVSIDTIGTFLPGGVTGQARHGQSGQEGILVSPGNANVAMNPSGAPVWVYTQAYSFSLSYAAATGTTTWSIDFNRDGDYLDSQESATRVSASLVNKTFGQVNLMVQGRSASGVGVASMTVSNLNVNGYAFGPFASTSDTALNTLFKDSSGQFGDILVTGQLTFAGSSTTQERPRMWVQLGDEQALWLVPLPGAALAGLSTLAGIGGLCVIRRRKQLA